MGRCNRTCTDSRVALTSQFTLMGATPTWLRDEAVGSGAGVAPARPSGYVRNCLASAFLASYSYHVTRTESDYASYGRAMEAVQVVEACLRRYLMSLYRVVAVQDKLKKKTMGQLIKVVEQEVAISSDLHTALHKMLDLRNRLAHDYFISSGWNVDLPGLHAWATSLVEDFLRTGVYSHTNSKGVTRFLNTKDVVLRGGKPITIVFFAGPTKLPPRAYYLEKLPEGRGLVENPTNGMVYLKKI